MRFCLSSVIGFVCTLDVSQPNPHPAPSHSLSLSVSPFLLFLHLPLPAIRYLIKIPIKVVDPYISNSRCVSFSSLYWWGKGERYGAEWGMSLLFQDFADNWDYIRLFVLTFPMFLGGYLIFEYVQIGISFRCVVGLGACLALYKGIQKGANGHSCTLNFSAHGVADAMSTPFPPPSLYFLSLYFPLFVFLSSFFFLFSSFLFFSFFPFFSSLLFFYTSFSPILDTEHPRGRITCCSAYVILWFTKFLIFSEGVGKFLRVRMCYLHHCTASMSFSSLLTSSVFIVCLRFSSSLHSSSLSTAFFTFTCIPRSRDSPFCFLFYQSISLYADLGPLCWMVPGTRYIPHLMLIKRLSCSKQHPRRNTSIIWRGE